MFFSLLCAVFPAVLDIAVLLPDDNNNQVILKVKNEREKLSLPTFPSHSVDKCRKLFGGCLSCSVMPEECGVLGRSQSKRPPPERQNHGVRLLWEQMPFSSAALIRWDNFFNEWWAFEKVGISLLETPATDSWQRLKKIVVCNVLSEYTNKISYRFLRSRVHLKRLLLALPTKARRILCLDSL